MKILLVCPYYAPENTIAAVRIVKFSQHWSEAGHEVKVLARHPVDIAGLDVPQGVEVIRQSDPLAKAHGSIAGGRYDTAANRPFFRRALESVARRLSPWPDRFAPWAVLAARRVRDEPSPDVVVASGGPLSALLLGAWLARTWNVPWVADYRDLLSTGHYLHRGRVRHRVEGWAERRWVRSASALLAVSPPMAESLGQWLDLPARTVVNGFDPNDYPGPVASTEGALRIAYCGEIYAERYDLSPLMEGLAALRPEERDRVKVEFYGRSVDAVPELARRFGVASCISAHARVAYEESLRIQQSADVLLLVLWDDPRNESVYTGKLFEYVGAGRPILSIGCPDGIAARLVLDRELGVVARSAGDVTCALRGWLGAKSGNSALPWKTSQSQVQDLTRSAQSERALEVLRKVAGADGANRVS